MPLSIALLSFNRPEYLTAVLESLAPQTRPGDGIFLFQDGGWSPSRGRWKADPDATRECTRLFRSYFPDADIFAATRNHGIAGNYRRAESFVFEALDADKALFLEDDLVLGRNYLDVIDQLLRIASDDDGIGYVSAYGDFWASLEAQRQVVGELRPMHENWGAALTKRSWLKQKPFRDEYWKLIENVDYEDRDHGLIERWYETLGYKGMKVSSQDGSRWIACAQAGMARLTTATCHARYIGEVGVHFYKELYDRYRYEHCVMFDEDVDIRPPDPEELAGWMREEVAALAQDYSHPYVRRGVEMQA